MIANLRLMAAVAAAALAGCSHQDSVEIAACAHVDGSYRYDPVDLSKLELVPTNKYVEEAVRVIPLCYAKHPVGPYENYLVKIGVYSGGGKIYVAYRIAGMTNIALLFRVGENGSILDATRTTSPFMTEVEGS